MSAGSTVSRVGLTVNEKSVCFKLYDVEAVGLPPDDGGDETGVSAAAIGLTGPQSSKTLNPTAVTRRSTFLISEPPRIRQSQSGGHVIQRRGIGVRRDERNVYLVVVVDRVTTLRGKVSPFARKGARTIAQKKGSTTILRSLLVVSVYV